MFTLRIYLRQILLHCVNPSVRFITFPVVQSVTHSLLLWLLSWPTASASESGESLHAASFPGVSWRAREVWWRLVDWQIRAVKVIQRGVQLQSFDLQCHVSESICPRMRSASSGRLMRTLYSTLLYTVVN